MSRLPARAWFALTALLGAVTAALGLNGWWALGLVLLLITAGCAVMGIAEMEPMPDTMDGPWGDVPGRRLPTEPNYHLDERM